MEARSDYFIQYFAGYDVGKNHPCMAATGSEGRCELCGKGYDAAEHQKPYEKVHGDA